MERDATDLSARTTTATGGASQGCLELPLPLFGPSAASVSGDPALGGTRWLCFGVAVPCAVFALWLPVAATSAMDRLSPRHQLLVGVLVIALMAVAIAGVVRLLRMGLKAGAWVRVDEHGFGYGTTRPGFDVAWARIVRHPDRSHDIGIAPTHRSEVLMPRLTFWCRGDDGTLVQRSFPLQLRDNAFRCLRFRNGHAVRVALLQRLAAMGLRFSPEVFVEAAVDPETWRPMAWPRRRDWLAVIVALAAVFLAVQVTWPAAGMVVCVFAILGLCLWGTLASRRSDPRLSRILVFRTRVDQAPESVQPE